MHVARTTALYCDTVTRVCVVDQAASWDKVAYDETDQMSYYERQQRKYGRGRRGSTSFCGAMFRLLDEFKNAEPLSFTAPDPATVPVPSRVLSAVDSARRGSAEELCNQAVELAVKLKSLQRERLVSRNGSRNVPVVLGLHVVRMVADAQMMVVDLKSRGVAQKGFVR